MIEPNAQEQFDKVQRIKREKADREACAKFHAGMQTAGLEHSGMLVFYCFCAIVVMVGLGVTLCQLTT